MSETEPAWDRRFEVDDPGHVAHAAEAVRRWSPSLELSRPPRNALLYEPEGTFYGACLAESITLRYNHAETTLFRGDMIVLPRDFALDAGPKVDLFGVVAVGHHPDHFRERFIQVFGFEHLKSQRHETVAGHFTSLIDPDDPRHRITYSVGGASRGPEKLTLGGASPLLLIGLEGTVDLNGPSDAHFRKPLHEVISPGQAMVLAPGRTVSVSGEGRFGAILLMNELEHEARRNRPAGIAWARSPEHNPG